jgi:hypothetical protein
MSDSSWDHYICGACWKVREPERMPRRVVGAPETTCCFCLKPTNSGIMIRRNPRFTPCLGKHALEQSA